MRPIAWFVTLALSITLLQFIDSVSSESANANTPLTVSGFCRSTDGTGTTEDSSANNNGYYTSLASRASDEVTGLKITPVFSKRLYADFSKNFDATYIAYQIENNTGAALANIQVVLSGFDGTQIGPVTDNDLKYTLSLPATSASKATAYFMVRAKGVTDADQLHEVRVFNSSGTQLAGCKTNIEGVQRSLSASANKVTSISVSTGSPTLGQTFNVVVEGTPGKIGSGGGPDLSVMAFSPATSSLWPTKAIRLEGVSFVLRGFNGNSAQAACQAIGAVFDKSTATWTNTLVLRNLASCATTNKHTYVATYTFRLIGVAATNPVIRPLSSIASGTQVKYTGTLPTVDVSIPLTNSVAPNVVKAAGTCTAQTEKVRMTYTVTITAPAGAVAGQNILIDSIRDQAPPGAQFVSASYRDAVATAVGGVSITKTDVVQNDIGYWNFAPANKFAVSSGTPAVLTYLVDYPKATTVDVSYTNRAFALYGDLVVASGDVITGIKTSLTTAGGCSSQTDNVAKDKTPQKITFEPPLTLGAGTTATLSAYSDSGLKVNLTSTTPSVCTVTEFNGVYSVYTITEGANCVIQATQDGNDKFAAATPVDKTIEVLKGQVITHTAGVFNTNTTTTVQVQATSKLKVLLTSVDTSVCTVSATEALAYNSTTGSTTYTINKGTATGSCILNATQSGGAVTADGVSTNWGPAPSKDIVIGVGTPQFIDFTSPAVGSSYQTTSGNFDVVATAKRTSDNLVVGNPIYFTSNSPTVCTIAASSGTEAVSGFNSSTGATTVNILIVGPGTCLIAANQDGLKDDGTDSGYASAQEVIRSISITGTGSTSQVLSIVDPGAKTYGDDDFTVQSTSKMTDSTATGLLVAITTSTPEVCQVGSSQLAAGVTETTLRLLSAGDCILLANQAGNNTYSKATQVTRTITVSVKQVSIIGLSATKQYDGTTAVNFSGTARLSGVVVGDGISELSLEGSASGSYPEAEVGNEKSISVTGFSISGTKASSYSLLPLILTGSISQRPISIKFSDVTVNRTGTPDCSVSAVAITSGTLVTDSVLDSIACSAFPTKTDGAMQNGSYEITPSNAVIKLSGVDKTSNYLITYSLGTLTVSGKKVPELIVESTSIVYGTADTALETVPKNTDTAGGVRARDKDDKTLLQGLLSYKLSNGNAVGKTLPVGTHTLTVVFTPSEGIKENYDNAQTTRTVTVKPRRLVVTGVSALEKVYDGTKVAILSGTPVLEADPVDGSNNQTEGYGLGLLEEDEGEVSLTGVAGAEFTSADVGTSIEVSYSGKSLTGTKAANYSLRSNITLRANIIPRKLAISLASSQKVYDGSTAMSTEGASLIALPVAQGGDGGGVVPGDEVEIDEAATGSDAVSATLTSASAGEAVPLNITGGKLKGAKSQNYELENRTGLTVRVIPRKLTMTGLSPVDKVYDGTRTANVSESGVKLSALAEADGGNVTCNITDPGCGVITEDIGQVELDGTAIYEFDSAEVGQSRAISFIGKSLKGDKKDNYQLVAPNSLSANILKRKLTVELPSYQKVYDGKRTLPVTGASLVALPTIDGGNVESGTGVVGEDDVSVDLDATGTDLLKAEFENKNAGTTKLLDFAGGKLKGTKSNNYELVPLTGIEGTILPRPIAFRTISKSMIKGQTEPTLNFEMTSTAPDTGFAETEDEETLGLTGASREPGTDAGKYLISLEFTTPLDPAAPENYEIEEVNEYLYIAEASIETSDPDPTTGEVEVTCNCAGLKPGDEVVLTMFSEPTILDSGTVEEDGTCPLLKGNTPPGSTGDHNLVLTGTFPNDDPLTFGTGISLAPGTDPQTEDPEEPAPEPSPTSGPSPEPSPTSGPSPEPEVSQPPQTPGADTPIPSSSPATGDGGSSDLGFTITLNYPNGFSGPRVLRFPPGTKELKLPVLEQKGFLFNGWNRNIVTRAGVKVLTNVSDDLDLYPVWQLLPKKNAVFFGPDSPKLSNETERKLSRLARRIARQQQSALLVVYGWVKRTADTSYSTQLSNNRARNVANFLRSKGSNVAVRYIEPKGVHPVVNNKARKAEIRVFFSGDFRPQLSRAGLGD